MQLKGIRELLAAEMRALEDKVYTLIQNDDRPIQQINQHTFQAQGKQLRPMLVFLAAGICGGITKKALRGAVLVTLLHQASLAHDDVVDEAAHRRGRPTINTAWNNKVAVLFGDYLATKGLTMATQYKDYDLLTLIIETAQAMSKGELHQLAQARVPQTKEADYLNIIYNKTAHFFGTCLAIGATAAGAPVAQVASLRQIGEQIGTAFQLRDDWLDYGNEELGKPLGRDLQEGKFTLPLIYALQEVSAQKRQSVLHAIQHAQQHEQVLAFVRQSSGMDYTQAMIKNYQNKALKSLAKMTTSPYLEGLCSLILHST